jgi:hypothetical protein
MSSIKNMTKPPQITGVSPAAAIPGGEVYLQYEPTPPETARALGFQCQGFEAHVIAAGRTQALVLIPDLDEREPVKISIVAGAEKADSKHRIIVGRKLAGGLHPVTNPAFHPADGSLFVTRSGSRGERVPTSIFRIVDGVIEEYSGDIMNPTGIAFDRLQRMFVTSRFDGVVYRMNSEGEAIAFASDLGIATGLAFNHDGEMFVGDRAGTIYRINEIGEVKPWAQHEPSVSAYHLAFGPDEALYITGPTVSSFDSIARFDSDGNVQTFYRGLGRPQGLAFDLEGNVYVAASLRGRRGIVRISPDARKAELVIAGMNVVGLAFGREGEMAIATNDSVFSLPLGIQGL